MTSLFHTAQDEFRSLFITPVAVLGLLGFSSVRISLSRCAYRQTCVSVWSETSENFWWHVSIFCYSIAPTSVARRKSADWPAAATAEPPALAHHGYNYFRYKLLCKDGDESGVRSSLMRALCCLSQDMPPPTPSVKKELTSGDTKMWALVLMALLCVCV